MDDINIRKIRKELDLSQRQLAEKLGVSIGTIQNWEAGKNIPASKYPILLDLRNSGDNVGNNSISKSNNRISLCPGADDGAAIIDELRKQISDKDKTIELLQNQLTWFQDFIKGKQ